jgi:hypothetical protein
MTLCPACNREATAAPGCAVNAFDDFADGIPRMRIPYGGDFRDHRPRSNCHDCNVAPGSFHHVGCDGADFNLRAEWHNRPLSQRLRQRLAA